MRILTWIMPLGKSGYTNSSLLPTSIETLQVCNTGNESSRHWLMEAKVLR